MKTLYPFQEAGVGFLLGGGALLADDPGAGKTVQAIEACKRSGARTVVVICPAVALAVWQREVADQWPEATAELLRDAGATGWAAVEGRRRPVVAVVGYEYLLSSALAQHLVAALAPFDVLICDEAHALKNPAAKRTMMVYGPGCAGGGVASLAKRTWLLTGTPMLNHPGELFPHLRATAPARIRERSYQGFTARYCTFKLRTIGSGRTRRSIEVIDGADRRTLPDLVKRMRGWWLRRRVEQFGIELPPLAMRPGYLAASDCDPDILARVEDSEEAELLRDAIAKGAFDDVREAQVSRLRRLLALAKLGAAVDWVQDALEGGEPKVALWGWHTEALERACLALHQYGAVLVDGSTGPRNRAGHVRRFQEDPDCRVFVGQIQAAGTAITLTACRRAVFLEQAWTPALNHQALKRHHRIGSTLPVLGQALCVSGSIDEAVTAILARKAGDIAALETEHVQEQA